MRILKGHLRLRLPFGINISCREPLGIPGQPYLVRWMVECKALGSIRLHHWLSSDDHRSPHDHSWRFITFVLRGRYFDSTPKWSPAGELEGWQEQELRAGYVKARGRDHQHYVRVPAGESCWSLLLTGLHARPFGFWVRESKRLKANKYFMSRGHHARDGSTRMTAKIGDGLSESIHDAHRNGRA